MATDSTLHIIESIAGIFAVGAVTAYIFRAVRLPTLLGFIFTGALLGPGGLGLIGGDEIETLAHIGVIFLLSGIAFMLVGYKDKTDTSLTRPDEEA